MKRTKFLVLLLGVLLLCAMSLTAFAEDAAPDWDTNATATVAVKGSDGTYTYYGTLAEALTGVYKSSPSDTDIVTVECKPNADVGAMTHAIVADSLHIVGNNAYVSGGEHDMGIDTYKYSRETGRQANDGEYLTKEIIVTVEELHGIAAWGERHTAHTVNLVFFGCQRMNRVYFTGTTGTINISLENCSFYQSQGSHKNTSVYSNAPGEIVIGTCSFDGIALALNINNKSDGAQTISVKDSTFTDCATATLAKETNSAEYAAPIRFVTSNANASITADVSGCSFSASAQTAGHGDILLGEGRTGKNSAPNVTLNVSGCTSDVEVKTEYPDGTASVSQTVAANETASVTMGAASVASVNGVDYATLAEAFAAAKSGDTVTLLGDVSIAPVDSGENALVSQMTITQDLTLDLAGYTIRYDPNVDVGPFICTPVMFSIENASVTITGSGTVDCRAGGNAYGINLYNGGNLTIENGTFLGSPTAVQVQAGSLTVNGGTFGLADGVPATLAKYVINAVDRAWKDGTATIAIKGGSFIGFDPADDPEGTGTTYIADGYVAVDNGDGTYSVEQPDVIEVTSASGTVTYYKTLASALSKARANATIKLLRDFTVGVSEAAPQLLYSATLDFNGHTITVPAERTTATNKFMAIWVRGPITGCTLTVEDSIGGGGIVSGDETTAGVYGFYVDRNSKLIINGGNFTVGTSAVEVNQGVATINGGTFKATGTTGRYLLNCVDDKYASGKASIIVTGGTFVGFDPADNPEGANTTYIADGYVSVDSGNGTYSVAEKKDTRFGSALTIVNQPTAEYNGGTYSPVDIYFGIDTLQYKEVGVEYRLVVTGDNATETSGTKSTTVVYSAMNVTTTAGEQKTYTPADLNASYMYGQRFLFDTTKYTRDAVTLYVKPYAVSLDGTETYYGEEITLSEDVCVNNGTHLFADAQ